MFDRTVQFGSVVRSNQEFGEVRSGSVVRSNRGFTEPNRTSKKCKIQKKIEKLMKNILSPFSEKVEFWEFWHFLI